MKPLDFKSQRGQSIVIVTIFILALIGILALVIDGGNGYLKRRRAQNAADAGALAGARALCGDPDNNSAIAASTAANYVSKNNASLLTGYPSIDTANRKVTVGTTISFDTFFGSVLNLQQMTANAIATAGCHSPSLATGVLPIIWYCKPSLTGEVGKDEDEICVEQFIDQPTAKGYSEENPQILNKELYVVMDNLKLPDEGLPCIENDPDWGLYYCDWDGDGKLDKIGSARGWTDLDGDDNNPLNVNCPPNKDGPKELEEWIIDGYSCVLDTHTWTPKSTFSLTDNLFANIECRINQDACPKDVFSKGPLVILPVYNDDCPEDTPASGKMVDCKPPLPPEVKWHGKDSINLNNPADKPYYFHIIHFAPFYISCVRGPGNKSWTPTEKVKTCPGYEALKAKNPAIKGKNTRSVEGYFVEGYLSGFGGIGDDIFLPNVFDVYLDD